MKAYREEAGVDWVQFESPHSVDEIKAARAAVDGPVLVHAGQARALSRASTSISRSGSTIAWYPGFSHAVTWAALWDFMTDFQARGTGAWDDFVESRQDRPYPRPEMPPDGEGDAKQQELENRYFGGPAGRRMMARDGYRIFDSDTHVGPDAAILSAYLSAAEKDRLAGWAPYKSRDRHGHVTYTKGSAAIAAASATPSPTRRRPATWPALPASSARASRRRGSMPTRRRASPTWISKGWTSI